MKQVNDIISKDEYTFIIDELHKILENHNAQLHNMCRDYYQKTDGIWPIIKYVLDRIETIFNLLIMQEAVWDAEIIFRSMLEVYFRIKYIILDPSEYDNKLNEYWHIMHDINKIKQSNKLSLYSNSIFQIPHHNLIYQPLLLNKNDLDNIITKYPSSVRKEISKKWAINEIINLLQKATGFETIGLLSFEYQRISHIVHGDEMGIGIIQERYNRKQEEYEITTISHIFRLFSTLFTISHQLVCDIKLFLDTIDPKYEVLDKLPDILENKLNKLNDVIFSDKVYDDYR